MDLTYIGRDCTDLMGEHIELEYYINFQKRVNSFEHKFWAIEVILKRINYDTEKIKIEEGDPPNKQAYEDCMLTKVVELETTMGKYNKEVRMTKQLSNKITSSM